MKQAITNILNKLFPFLHIGKHIPFQGSYVITLRQALDNCDWFTLNEQPPYREDLFYEIKLNDFGHAELTIELEESSEAAFTAFNFFANQKIEIDSYGYASVVNLHTDAVCKFCFTVNVPMKKSDLVYIVNRYE